MAFPIMPLQGTRYRTRMAAATAAADPMPTSLLSAAVKTAGSEAVLGVIVMPGSSAVDSAASSAELPVLRIRGGRGRVSTFDTVVLLLFPENTKAVSVCPNLRSV